MKAEDPPLLSKTKSKSKSESKSESKLEIKSESKSKSLLWTTTSKFSSPEEAHSKINTVFNNVIKSKAKCKSQMFGENLAPLVKGIDGIKENYAAKLLILYAIARAESEVAEFLKKDLGKEFRKAHREGKVFFYLRDLLNALQKISQKPLLTAQELEEFDKLGGFLSRYIKEGNEQKFTAIQKEKNLDILKYIKEFDLEKFCTSLKEKKVDDPLSIIFSIKLEIFDRNERTLVLKHENFNV